MHSQCWWETLLYIKDILEQSTEENSEQVTEGRDVFISATRCRNTTYVAVAITFYVCIWKAIGSNLVRDTGYRDAEFSWFLWFRQREKNQGSTSIRL
jgi:hypothetical protein